MNQLPDVIEANDLRGVRLRDDADRLKRGGVRNAQSASLEPLRPGVGRRIMVERLRLCVRWGQFMARSIARRDFDFAANAIRAEARLACLWALDALPHRSSVACNICGWHGRVFYPNVGPGYDEPATICPGCGCLDRHRALLYLLRETTDFFDAPNRVIEVAPPRRFQELCLARPGLDYTSFDIARFAMERGDLTAMRFADDSADYFLCFHVLEHIPDEDAAIREIMRVLKPGGTLVMQVPVDWELDATYEYEEPDPREVDHVRRYGRDLPVRLRSHGLQVDLRSAKDHLDQVDICRFGLSTEPIVFARRLPST